MFFAIGPRPSLSKAVCIQSRERLGMGSGKSVNYSQYNWAELKARDETLPFEEEEMQSNRYMISDSQEVRILIGKLE